MPRDWGKHHETCGRVLNLDFIVMVVAYLSRLFDSLPLLKLAYSNRSLRKAPRLLSLCLALCLHVEPCGEEGQGCFPTAVFFQDPQDVERAWRSFLD